MSWLRKSQAWMCKMIFWGLLLSLLSVFVRCNISPCSVKQSSLFDGVEIDCSALDLTAIDLIKLNNTRFSEKVVSLNISFNKIVVLLNKLFSNFKFLRILKCSVCHLNSLQVDALKGLDELEILDLSTNYDIKIIDYSFPFGFFRPVQNLRVLNLGWNMNYGIGNNYSNFIDIFDTLTNLTHLTIDSFENLRIGEEFTKFKRLESLTIVCSNLRIISNNSFEGFQNSNVQKLEIIGGKATGHLGLMLFHYLPNVSSLIINYLQIGNHNILKMMKPLQGRRFGMLHFDDVGLGDVDDGILREADTTFLRNVCVSHFEWLGSQIIAAETRILISPVWATCLQSITINIQYAELFYTAAIWELLGKLRKLERFILSKTDHDNDQDAQFSKSWEANDNADKAIMNTTFKSGLYFPFHSSRREISSGNQSLKKGSTLLASLGKSPCYYHRKNDTACNTTKNNSINKHRGLENFTKKKESDGQVLIITLPPCITTLIVDASIQITISTNLIFSPNNLKAVSFRNFNVNGIYLGGTVLGLDKLEYLDLKSTPVNVTPDIFKEFHGLKELIMEESLTFSLGSQEKFIQTVAKNMPNLEYFNLAKNNLRRLPENTFRLNKKLKRLCLKGNHFSKIPFDLKNTPNLEILDLSDNSIVSLFEDDIKSLDDHIGLVPNFSLYLVKNQISCGCSSFSFIAWIQRHQSNLGAGGNYPCTNEYGDVITTAHYRDILILWRLCRGHDFYLMSFIMAATLIAVYLGAFIGMKHQTQILSKVMMLVVPGFQLLTRKDFDYDVAIGYANQDVDFVRNVLLKYLEDKWHLHTFVHQRDMLQDPLMMHTAIRCSWRTVLLITKDFLEHYEMAHNVMKVATFFINPTNPRSVVVMVEESVEHQIPEYVLEVVDDDNIIVLPRLQDFLDYEATEMLKTRLL